MTKSLTPSQIHKLVELFVVILRKLNPLAQDAQNLIEYHWHDLRKEVEEALTGAVARVLERTKDTVVRRVKVDRRRTPADALHASRGSMEQMGVALVDLPKSAKASNMREEVFFFQGPSLERSSYQEVAEEYRRRGLKPDFIAQAAVNEAEPEFSAKYPNATVWEDHGRLYWVLFAENEGFKQLTVAAGEKDQCGGFDRCWWFAGTRIE